MWRLITPYKECETEKSPLFEVYGKCAFQGKKYALIRQENKELSEKR